MKSTNPGRRPKTAAGGRGGSERRKRTHFTQKEVAILVEAFAKNPYPGFDDREKLASKVCKLEPRVHVWFQNRRARHLRSTNFKACRNLLQNLSLQAQPRESIQAQPSYAAAAQNFISEPNQPGRSWNLPHPMGQYQQESNFQQHNSSFGTGQTVSFPQSNFDLGSVAKGMQSNFGGDGNLPLIQLQDQQNRFYQQPLPQNYYSAQDLLPSGNLQLGGQVCAPHQFTVQRMNLSKQQDVMHHFHFNQGTVNEENGYVQTSLAGISPILYSDQVQLERKARPHRDSLSHESRWNMSLGYDSNVTTPSSSPSTQCQEEALQDQFLHPYF